MKSFTILALPLLASAAAIRNRAASSLAGRQLDGGESQDPVSIEQLEPEFDSAATREVALWGPLTLLPANATHEDGPGKLDPSSDIFQSALSGICTDCMVLSAQAQIAFEDDSRADIADGVYTHHIIMNVLGREPVIMDVAPVCQNGTVPGSGFGSIPGVTDNPTGGGEMDGHSHGTSEESTPEGSCGAPTDVPEEPGQPSGPAQLSSVLIGTGDDSSRAVFVSNGGHDVKSGFFIGTDTSVLNMAEVINYDNVEKEIYISLDYEYLPGGRPEGYLDVGMGAINVDGCGEQLDFHPPDDRAVTVESEDWEVNSDGYLINFTPHLHDGGINIKVFVNDEMVCQSDAVYGSDDVAADVGGEQWETISEYSTCEEAVPVKKGDLMSMTADYDLTQHALRPDSMDHEMGAEAMALANFMFAEEASA